MVGRQEKPLDAASGPVAGFAFALRKLRHEAGRPTYSAMARRSSYSVATLSRAAGGEQLPTLPVVLAYVTACGGDPQEWEERWQQVSEELTAARVRDRSDEQPPYRGLARFEPGDQALFFGRDRLADDLSALTTEHRVVAVFGASGSGKSSLLRAGLIPRLRDAGSQGLPRPGAIRILTPGEHPLATHGSVLVPSDAAGDTWLVVDQFEEVFTLCHDEVERGGFIDALLEAGTAAGRLRVVLGVRADFYARCLDHSGLAALIRDASLPVGRMTAAELRQAIIKPAAACGLVVERALTETLVEEVATGTCGLPMLSHALLETWRGRRGRTLSLEAYERAGGIRGAIAQSAEAAYEAMDAHQAGIARQVMLRLITPGDGAPDTRRPTTRAELEAIGDGLQTHAVLEILARARLITLGEDTVDLAHETLITAWPRLHGWIDADREGLRLHRWLTEAAAAWESVGRDPAVRISPVRLTQLRDFTTTDGRSELTALESDFLAAGTATHRRTIRRRRTARATMSLLAVLAVLAGTVAWQQNRAGTDRRQLNAALHTAAVADGLRATDPATAARLSLAAWSMAHTPETKAALYAAHTHRAEPDIQLVTSDVQPESGIQHATGDVQRQSGWLGPDGTTLIVHKEGEVEQWDVRTGRRTATHAVDGAPKPLPPVQSRDLERVDGSGYLRPSPDGRWAVVTTHGGRINDQPFKPTEIRLWDVVAGTRHTIVRENKSAVTSTSWGDGSRLLATAVQGRAEVWDVATRRLVLAADAAEDGLDVALSANGRRLALCAPGGNVEIWDVARRTRVSTPDPHLLSLPGGVCPTGTLHLSPDGGRLALKLTTGLRLIGLDAEADDSGAEISARDVTELAFSTDGTFLAALRKDAVLLWRIDEHGRNALVFSQPLPNEMPTDIRFDAAAGKLRYLRAGSLGVATIALDQALRTPWSRFPADPVYTSPDAAHTITMRREGADHVFEQRPVTGGAAGPGLRLPPLRLPQVPPEGLTDLAQGTFSPDGSLFAYGLRDAQGTAVRLWDVRGRRALPDLPVPAGARAVVALEPVVQNGMPVVYAILAGDSSALWDLTRRQRIAEFPNGPSSMAVRPDGKLLVLGDGAVVMLPENVVLRPTSQRALGSALAFNGDGSLFALSDGVGRVTLWNGVVTQRLGVLSDGLPTAAGEPAPLTALAFSHDGTVLATGDELGRIRLWDAESRKALGTALLGPGDEVTRLTFAPDDRTLRSQGRYTAPLEHPVAPEDVVAALCSRLGGGLERMLWHDQIPEVPYRESCPRTTSDAR
ncbi:helix-turn-helix domain-containing protein [Streptomyces sp. NPDC093225]|uniref:nSTAND1 domain-containing NTPase n=1 Tax=Streptomyces sp. NPDC093225 TaxID=3366034 RepID=UPI00380F3924